MGGRQLRSENDDPVAGALAAAWLTRPLSVSVRHYLAERGEIRTMPAGALITREGEPTRYLAVILDGRVAIRTHVAGRDDVTILTVEPGDVVGWSALSPPYRATSTAIAVAPLRCICFDAAQLRQLLDTTPRVAAEIYPLVLSAVARRLEGARMQLLDLFSQNWTQSA